MRYLFPFLLLASSLSSCKIVDLSNSTAKEETTLQAKTILEQAQKAHGADKWAQVTHYTVQFEDEFYGGLGGMINPFKGNPVSIQLDYVPKQFGGEMTFQQEKMAGEVWGMKNGETYIQKADGTQKVKPHKDAQFWIPTYQYFIEFPARILEANVFRMMGIEKMNGKTYDRVLATWNQVEPQKEMDQYVIWVEQETRLIGKVAYTIREANKFVSGYAMFEDIKDFDGVKLPTRMPVGSNLVKEGKWLHEMRIKEVKLQIR
ncbi:MAG: hypothetical protein AAFW00_18175 [Bacteroidota bacterium]